MPAPDTDYRDLAGSLRPVAVSQYLAATGDWTLETRQEGVREIWQLSALPRSSDPSVAGIHPRGRIMLPLATDFADFGQRFRDALNALAMINDWSPLQLERRILATRADLLLVRLDQEHSGESIPLRQAETTVEAIYRMLRAAAMTTATPGYNFRGGRLPAPVSEFLEEDVELGHTQRGSFVFTVVARLDASASPGLRDPALAASRQAPQFSRRVMETLALGIQTAKDLAEGGTSTALRNPAEWGLSAGLIESLERITEPAGLRSVDLSFEWAAAESRPEIGIDSVMIDHTLLEGLTRVHEQLLQLEEPVRRETLAGTVVTLSREEEGFNDEEAASVIISADIGGRMRNVHLTLTGRWHDLAIQAYRLKLPIVVTGDLVFTRRTWWLEGNIELDEEALIRQIADARRSGG
jgi:hypothetical protein